MDRRAIAISGIVQGVGFRPYVYGLATRLRLYGFIQKPRRRGHHRGGGGAARRWIDSCRDLTSKPPPLARIDELHWSSRPPRGDPSFRIEPSEVDATSPIFISPDVATCDDCVAELFDPPDRRYRYPFLNCTNCGPRLTIITGAPYDRERTSMAGFAMCPACRAEYEDPSDRRFHAQPTACPSCGPRLEFLDDRGQPVETADPIARAAEALRQGMIGAIKGLGGYHLACVAGPGAEFEDPGPAQAVAELRRRKHRDEKPFALMVARYRRGPRDL